jgi:Uma2 family endonuclease
LTVEGVRKMSATAWITAEQFAELPDRRVPTELVRGREVEGTFPTLRHGAICSRVIQAIGDHVEERHLGHTVALSGIVTERGPDTVRGADVSFYSYDRVPPGRLPDGYLSVMPELVCEVRSHDEPGPQMLARAAEYVNAGVRVVCVLDEMTETVTVFRDDVPPLTLRGADELHLPDVLGDFRVPVRQFFE